MKNILKMPNKLLKKVKYVVTGLYQDSDAVKNMKTTKESFVSRKNRPMNVVFIAQYIAAWNKHVWIYNEVLKRDNMNAYILCVPSNIENNSIVGDASKNDVYDYFVNHGYENCINAYENGKWFDLKSLSPDYVFHSRPYNHFMPIEYTSGNISKYAKICNFLYGASFFVNMRNVTLNKNYFRHCSYYFTIDESEKNFWENKFSKGYKAGVKKSFAVGTPAFQSILTAKTTKKDSRKTFIWTPRWSTDSVVGGSNFFKYKDVLPQIIGEKAEAELIMRPHPLMFGNFVKQGLMTENEVEDYKNMCTQKGNIRFDTEKEYIDTLWQTDFMITDVSGIVIEYFVTGKPIIFCKADIADEYTEVYKRIFDASYIVENENELKAKIEMLMSGEDPQKEKREKTISEFLKKGANASEQIIDVLEKDFFGL